MKHEPPTTGKKYCPACEQSKSVLAFAADPHRVDGMQKLCRPCDYATYHKPRRLRNKDSGALKPKWEPFKW